MRICSAGEAYVSLRRHRRDPVPLRVRPGIGDTGSRRDAWNVVTVDAHRPEMNPVLRTIDAIDLAYGVERRRYESRHLEEGC